VQGRRVGVKATPRAPARPARPFAASSSKPRPEGAPPAAAAERLAIPPAPPPPRTPEMHPEEVVFLLAQAYCAADGDVAPLPPFAVFPAGAVPAEPHRFVPASHGSLQLLHAPTSASSFSWSAPLAIPQAPQALLTPVVPGGRDTMHCDVHRFAAGASHRPPGGATQADARRVDDSAARDLLGGTGHAAGHSVTHGAFCSATLAAMHGAPHESVAAPWLVAHPPAASTSWGAVAPMPSRHDMWSPSPAPISSEGSSSHVPHAAARRALNYEPLHSLSVSSRHASLAASCAGAYDAVDATAAVKGSARTATVEPPSDDAV